MRQRTYRIRGMDCAEEVAALKCEVCPLLGADGNVKFDLINGKMTVDLPEEGVPEDAIVQAVARTGMQAVPWGQQIPKQSGAAGFWQRHGRMAMAVASGIACVFGFLIHAATHGLTDAFVTGEGGDHRFPLVSIASYVAAAIMGGWFIFPKAVASARRMRPDMNLLMTVAALGAMAIGEWFEAATVTFLFSIALLLESWSVERARRAISALLNLSPPRARIICPTDGDIEEKPVEDVPVGATVVVRPGERIPLDGVLTKGSTSVNQAPITGESMPVSKNLGQEVFAGTINEDGAFEFRTTKAATDTTLARIIRMVEEAQSRRASTEQWVEKFARYYTPAMMVLALAIALVPPLLLGGAWDKWIYEALVILVIACPCALVISTPVSIVAGLSAAARAGVLIKGGMYLEAPARLRVIAFDKTGTLTRGQPEVQRIIPLNDHSEDELLQRAASLETLSDHPLARAIVRKAMERNLKPLTVDGFQSIKGKGAEGYIEGRLFWLGSHRMLHEKGAESPEMHEKALTLEDAGHSVVIVGNDHHVCGMLSVGDALRPESLAALRDLKAAGIERTIMLTGDNEGTARAVADACGVDEFRAELLPEDKVQAVESLTRQYGRVAMVGDGVNDAPAMAAANLAIAMGAAGTDAAIETADIALMSDDLSKIPWLVRHSRRTLAVIQQNIVFALGLKLLFIVLALSGLATLWMAIAADMGASLLVIFNGLRLLGGGRQLSTKPKIPSASSEAG
ncbi:MAG TPA: heavy metal translocating P-type ATPase [Candidatus Hydrogenedentes bacterium]|nr:heavy metal translocating P-type ATPase [Candidatus Hydrogenedentota bacterium]